MQRISKTEMDYLIEKGVLKQSKGNYGDSLVVTNKQGGKSKKQRYVTDPVYNYLLRLKEQDKLELEKSISVS